MCSCRTLVSIRQLPNGNLAVWSHDLLYYRNRQFSQHTYFGIIIYIYMNIYMNWNTLMSRYWNAWLQLLNFVIQIKICAEYRDMLPRPRLVCQEPGLRPIGRSPGVPDKSSRGLGSMSRYSAQILICFIAYIFSIFNFSVGLVGNLAELPPCTVPPATVHCYQNEAAQCSSDNQISQHALLRGSRKKHSLAFMPQNWWN